MSSMWSFPHEDLVCPVCQDIYKDPVVLRCSHSFCNSCVSQWWKTKRRRECPFCKAVAPRGAPVRNLVLRNFCEAFQLEMESGVICNQHYEKLKLYCVDDRVPLCVVCSRAKEHRDHTCIPTDEAAKKHRSDLEQLLPTLRQRLASLSTARSGWQRLDFKSPARDTEEKIRGEFQVLRGFLDVEERTRIKALREEEGRKTKEMNDAINELNREITTLESTIKSIEEGMNGDNTSLLLKVDDITKKTQRPLPEAKEAKDTGIDIAKHLGNLGFLVWYKMKDLVTYTPVVLNPNTAHQELELSKGLTSVRCGPKLPQKVLSRTPDRIHHSVLGQDGFTSGIHIWDVQVGNNPVWALGVCTQDAQMRSNVQSGLWMVRFCKTKFTAYSPPEVVSVLPLRNPLPWTVRVLLDYNKGKLCFLDLDRNTVIHVFTHTFTEELFPYINTWEDLPLKILPLTHSVTVNHHTG